MIHSSESLNSFLASEQAPHRKLILLCARTQLNEKIADSIRAVLQQQVDWERCLAEASRQEVAPLLWWNLRHFEIPDAYATTRMRAIYYNNLNRNLILSNELLLLCKLFKENGIPFVPLKGMILGETVYGHAGLRYLQDLDILIRRCDVAPVATLLSKTGNYTSCRDVAIPCNEPPGRSMTFARAHGPAPYHLDLQWKLKDSFLTIPAHELWTHLTSFEWEGERLNILSPELTLIHLTHHLHAHGFTLKILVDVAETLQRYRHSLNWQEIFILISKWKMKRNFATVLECVSSVLGYGYPEAAQGLRRLIDSAGWRSAMVVNPKWYFSRSASAIQSNDYLRVCFSGLFVDDGYVNLARSFVHRLLFWSRRFAVHGAN